MVKLLRIKRWGIFLGVLLVSAAGWYTYQYKKQTTSLVADVDAITLPDITLGSAQAPYEVIMYFALDCAHCRLFEQEILPKIRKKFIDTGQVRFILRDFPLGPAGLLASKIAWIRGQEHYFETISVLLDRQDDWNVTDGYTTQLKKIAQEVGLTSEEYNRCLNDRDLEDAILLRRLQAQKKDNVDAVPTFIVNGERIEDVLTVKLLKKLLKGKPS